MKARIRARNRLSPQRGTGREPRTVGLTPASSPDDMCRPGVKSAIDQIGKVLEALFDVALWSPAFDNVHSTGFAMLGRGNGGRAMAEAVGAQPSGGSESARSAIATRSRSSRSRGRRERHRRCRSTGRDPSCQEEGRAIEALAVLTEDGERDGHCGVSCGEG